MITAETINPRNVKVFSDGRFIGWITREDHLMGEPRWGFTDLTFQWSATGWNYRTVEACLAAIH